MTTRTVPATGLLAISDALDRIRAHAPVSGLEHVDVADSLGRFLAEEVIAPYPVPAYDSSAMDGYALRFADLTPELRMPVQGRVAAGHPLGEELRPGHAVRIFTGGAMPAGADTVALQEDCAIADASVLLPPGLVPGANRRLAGEDMAAGTTVLVPGTRIGPQHIGVATAVGRTSLTVRRRIRVAVIATGDELRPPGQELPPGCVHDTNRHAIGAALRALGAEVDDVGVVPDRRELIRDTMSAAAARNDLIVSTGGVSAGEEDHVRAVVEALGALEFWRLPVKPGKSIAVGEVNGAPFVGLPGNPVAAMVAFWLIGRPLALRLMGATEIDNPRFPVIADFSHQRRPGRREFLRARLRTDPDGSARAEIFPSAGSGIMRSLAWAEGLIEIPEEDGNVGVGDIVRYVPYSVLDH
jgi:molybdopterin molybdotransferase